jgi:hypothetical protein
MQTLTVLLSIQLNTQTELHSRHAPSKLDWLNQHQRAWQQGVYQGFPDTRFVGRETGRWAVDERTDAFATQAASIQGQTGGC